MKPAPHPHPHPHPSNRVEVAAAVITRPDGSFLLGQRPAGRSMRATGSFPAGKSRQASQRPRRSDASCTRSWESTSSRRIPGHPRLRLRARGSACVFRVVEWSGTPHGRKASGSNGSAPARSSHATRQRPYPQALTLPAVYGISNAADVGEREFLRRLERALAGGLALLQVREKQLPPDDWSA